MCAGHFEPPMTGEGANRCSYLHAPTMTTMPSQISMPSQIPAAIQNQKYISLTTYRKNGTGVPTPVWFGEQDGKVYVMTRSDMGKTKRIRNNPQVKVAPCTIRGKVTGPEFAATARI